MRCRPVLPALALALWLCPQGPDGRGAARAEPAGCGAPPELLDATPLPGVIAGLAHGTLRVLVVGSASSAAGGTSGAEAVWPQRLDTLLEARLAPVQVQVESYARRGSTAAEHARIIAAEVPRFRPHLVIWQLGTVEAARGVPPDEMSDAVLEAAARLRATRGESTDLVLMDMQFSRFFRANANVDLYRDRMRMAAVASGAQLFSRWSIMYHWAESGRLDLERAPREQRVALADELHDCLARALAAFILAGAQRDRR